MRILAVLLAVSSAAAAQEAWPEFPKAGRFVPLGAMSINYQTQGGQSATVVQVTPTLLYLATDHLVLGADFAFRSASFSGGGSSITQWGADLIGGAVFSLAPRVSVLILPSVGFLTTSSGSNSRTAVAVGGTVPLLVHLAPHFFVGLGPQLSAEITASQSVNGVSANTAKLTTFGFQVFLGGWI